MTIDGFLDILLRYQVFSVKNVVVLLVLTALNWYFEILKWKSLSSYVRENSFKETAKESLASFTAAIFTPSRIGEYGAKCLYYSRSYWKKIVFLNFLGNMGQLFVTYFFGIAGLLYLITTLDLPLPVFNASAVGLLLILPFAIYWAMKRFKVRLKGFSVQRLEESFHEVPQKIRTDTVLFATLRYLIFTHQFYFLLLLFQVDLPYALVISAVFSVYLLASVIPTMIIFDAVIKGGFAIWIFGLLNVPEIIVMSVVLTAWILNFGAPGFAGSYFVLKYRQVKPATP